MKGATIRRQFREPRAERAATPEPKPQGPSRVARLLALAHHVESLLGSGQLKSHAEAARQLGLTRARMTQVSNLLLLSPEIQERLLTENLRVAERSLRPVGREPMWECQDAALVDS